MTNNQIKSLNLLSTDDRETVRYERMFLIVRNMTLILLGLLIFSSATLYEGKINLASEADLLQKQAQAVDDRSSKINQKISTVNKMLIDIEKIQKEDIQVDKRVLSIINAIPEGVKINSLKIDKETLIFEIAGVLPTRSSYLEIKSQFEQDKKTFNEISLPSIALTAKTDIPFTMSGRLIVEGFTPKVKKTQQNQPKTAE